jgi:hypothetical protein
LAALRQPEVECELPCTQRRRLPLLDSRFVSLLIVSEHGSAAFEIADDTTFIL